MKDEKIFSQFQSLRKELQGHLELKLKNSADFDEPLKRLFRFISKYDLSSDFADYYGRKVIHLKNMAISIAAQNRNAISHKDFLELLTLPQYFPYKRFEFSLDLFSEYIPIWATDLSELRGKKPIHVLEIGSFEGFSSCWILENLIRNRKSTLTCVDEFPRKHFLRFKKNISLTKKTAQVVIVRGRSQELLRNLWLNKYDLIYVDGSHVPEDLRQDLHLSWPLLKKGGIMIIDDYLQKYPRTNRYRIKSTVDGFFAGSPCQFRVIRRDYQLTVRKMALGS